MRSTGGSLQDLIAGSGCSGGERVLARTLIDQGSEPRVRAALAEQLLGERIGAVSMNVVRGGRAAPLVGVCGPGGRAGASPATRRSTPTRGGRLERSRTSCSASGASWRRRRARRDPGPAGRRRGPPLLTAARRQGQRPRNDPAHTVRSGPQAGRCPPSTAVGRAAARGAADRRVASAGPDRGQEQRLTEAPRPCTADVGPQAVDLTCSADWSSRWATRSSTAASPPGSPGPRRPGRLSRPTRHHPTRATPQEEETHGRADDLRRRDPQRHRELRHRVQPDVSREEVGTVTETGDGIARVEGLPTAMTNELLEFESGPRAWR